MSDIVEYRGYRMPYATAETIVFHVAFGRPVGSFTEAVLRNDLIGAFARADIYNTRCMRDVVAFVHNCVPGACIRDNYDAWRDFSQAERVSELAIVKVTTARDWLMMAEEFPA